MHVWTQKDFRDSVTDIENLPIDTPNGGQVPLKRIANIDIKPIANAIKHERQTRRLDASADVAGPRPGLDGRRTSRRSWRRSTCRPATTPRCSARRRS